MFNKPTLIVICGWPFSGKTTLAKALEKALGIYRADIDEIRTALAGLACPHPDKSPELTKKDEQEMGLAYRMLIAAADANLGDGQSIIITATFSRKVGQQMLLDLMAEHLNAQMKIIQCIPSGDSDEEVTRRMANRDFGEGDYMGAVNSVERYKEVKTRYDPIELPHWKLRTWGSWNDGNTQQEAIEAIGYLAMP